MGERLGEVMRSIDLPEQIYPDAQEVVSSLGIFSENPSEVFEVLEHLGEGSFGSVYKCRRRDDGMILAVKVIPYDGSNSASLRQEIEILRTCSSPFIVSYYGAYYLEGDIWIAMDFCAAGSIGDLMQICCRTLSEDEIRRVCVGILRALCYLHDNHKIHRDIKAGNVLLDGEGNVKVADFGVSAQLKDTWGRRQSVIGTPYWMAPEVLKEIPYDSKADIWSFGVTCIEMAQGQPPLAGIHPMRVIFIIPSATPPNLADQSKWSPQFINFISRCVQHDPNLRPTAQELLSHEFLVGHLDQPAPLLQDLVNECLGQIDKYRTRGAGGNDDAENDSDSASSDAGSDDEVSTKGRDRTNTVITTSSKGTVSSVIHVENGRDGIVKDGTFSRTLVMRQIRQQVNVPIPNLPPLPPPPPALFATPRKVGTDIPKASEHISTPTGTLNASPVRAVTAPVADTFSEPLPPIKGSSTQRSLASTVDRTFVSPVHRLLVDEAHERIDGDDASDDDDAGADLASLSRVPVQQLEETIIEVAKSVQAPAPAPAPSEDSTATATGSAAPPLSERSGLNKKNLHKLRKLYLAHPDRTRAWTLVEGAVDWKTLKDELALADPRSGRISSEAPNPSA